MDRKIRLERKATGQQKNGQPLNDYVSYWKGSAGKKDESIAKETESGKQIVATGRTIWTKRWSSGIRSTDRLVDETDPDNEVIYNIEGSKEKGRREATEIQTRLVNP